LRVDGAEFQFFVVGQPASISREVGEYEERKKKEFFHGFEEVVCLFV
jgi:hypothetical protein